MGRPFLKMNGLGNDFVVVDAGSEPFSPGAEEVRAIADRFTGIGCDQLVALEPSDHADARVRLWNADGGEVERCGNAERCVAWLLMQASGRDEVRMEVGDRVIEASRAGEHAVTVDMGPPMLDWKDSPLSGPMDTLELDLHVEGAVGGPGAVSMGNPHVVFFVTDAEAVPVAALGPWFETHRRFPQRVNVGFAQVTTPDHMRLRVWERGAGLTRACGTGACAAVVAAHRRGLAGRKVTVDVDGGALTVEWREEDDHVLMTGPVEVEFTGRLPEALAHDSGDSDHEPIHQPDEEVAD